MPIGNFVEEFPVKEGVKIADLETMRDCDNAIAYLTMRLRELDPLIAAMRDARDRGEPGSRVDFARANSEFSQVKTGLRFVHERRHAIANRESIHLLGDEYEAKSAIAIVRTLRDQNAQLFATWRERARAIHPQAFV